MPNDASTPQMFEKRNGLSRVTTVISQAPLVVSEYRAKMLDRVRQLLADSGIGVAESDLIREVSIFSDRSDINEELARLRSHLEQFRSAVNAPGEVGKRLDFLLQELNREANTVLSKSTEVSIKEAGLVIKAEVEKLREQVQNVE